MENARKTPVTASPQTAGQTIPAKQAPMDGNWDQIKGRAKKTWSGLTDADFTKANGSADKLYGVIHDRFGETTEAIKAKLAKNGQK